MKMFKMLAGILGVAGLISGCGKSETGKTSAPDKPYNIVWYSVGTPQKDLDKVMEKVNEYVKGKINATVEMKLVDWADYEKKIKLIESSGENFDMCFTSSWCNDYRVASKMGYFLPLNELLQKYAKGTLDIVDPILFQATQINGVNYSVPVQKEMAYQLVYGLNKTYVDKYHMDISKVKTLDDLYPFFKTIKENEPEVIPFAVWGNLSYLFGDMDFILDSRIPGAMMIEKDNHKVINQFENKEFLDKIKIYRKLYLAGFIPADAPQIFDNASVLKTGKWFCMRFEYQPFAENIYFKAWGYHVIPIPAFKPVIGPRSTAGAMIAISSTCQNPDVVMKFINMLNTDSYLRNLLGYGLENVHYKKTGDNSIEYLPANKDYQMPSFTLGNLFITYVLSDDPKDKWAQFKKWNESGVTSPLLGFTFDSEPVKTEMAAVKNIADEFCMGMFCGATNPDTELPKMMKKMKDAGSDKILAEMQKQYDEFIAKKSK